MDNKYNRSRIYKLVSKDLSHDKVYIGSTYQDLRVRLAEHKANYKKWLNDNKKYMTSVELFKLGEVDIIELEKFPCSDKSELHSRERFYIESMDCVNKVIPNRTKKEYYHDNKDKIKEYYHDNKDKIKNKVKEYYHDNKDKIKEYYHDNKDKINEQKKEKITCQCGSTFVKYQKLRHEKTMKHINFINSQ
jgi:hypothetical protein